MIVIEEELIKALVVNVYGLNDHYASDVFMEKVYVKVLELLDKHPDAYVIIEGDFNASRSEIESLNRLKTKLESYLIDYIRANNSTCEVMDA